MDKDANGYLDEKCECGGDLNETFVCTHHVYLLITCTGCGTLVYAPLCACCGALMSGPNSNLIYKENIQRRERTIYTCSICKRQEFI